MKMLVNDPRGPVIPFKRNRCARFILGIMAVKAVVFICLAKEYGKLGSSPSAPGRALESALQGDRQVAPSQEQETNPAVLESALTAQIRTMSDAVARMEEEAKEDRIEYALLLQRGYAATNRACLALLERQRQLRENMESLVEGIQEADGLRRRLALAIQEQQSASAAQRGVDVSLRTEVLRCVNRLGSGTPTMGGIPEAVWKEDGEPSRMEGINRD